MADPAPVKQPPLPGQGRAVELHPRWEWIEEMLMHGWSPEEVVLEFQRTYPGEHCPHARTLYRFLQDKPDEWYVKRLGARAITSGAVKRALARRAPKLNVLCILGDAIEVQLARVAKLLKTEEILEGLTGDLVSNELDRLADLCLKYFKVQQDLGLMPRAGDNGHEGDEPPAGLTLNQFNITLEQVRERAKEIPTEQLRLIVTGARILRGQAALPGPTGEEVAGG